MTRVLSELLDAEQPAFSLLLRNLEHAAGKPSADVHLISDINQTYSQKVKELGLDANDTTARELYHGLSHRFEHDEKLVRDVLGLTETSSVDEVLSAIQRIAQKTTHNQKSMAMKHSVAKRLLKKTPPKKTMKQLNYRSLESLIKHEPVAQVFAASFLIESKAWRRKFLEQYSQLQANDFEYKNIEILLPTSQRWKKLAETTTDLHKQNILSVYELGAVVILPLKQDIQGLAIIDLLLILHACNEIMCINSYLKLQHVRPDFGAVVKSIAETEPVINTQLINQHVPWTVVHKYYSANPNAYNSLIFEPHLHKSDFHWYSPEKALAALHPDLHFWKNTHFVVKHSDGENVSLNLLDVAINFCNSLPFAERATNYVRQNLWHELMTRYLNVENVEHTITQEMDLQPEFAELENGS